MSKYKGKDFDDIEFSQTGNNFIVIYMLKAYYCKFVLNKNAISLQKETKNP